MGADKVLIDRAHGSGTARPYGLGGNLPANAVVSARRPHGTVDAVLYVSDTPYVEAYADRAVCSGKRTDGHPCKAKARPGERMCEPHSDQV